MKELKKKNFNLEYYNILKKTIFNTKEEWENKIKKNRSINHTSIEITASILLWNYYYWESLYNHRS